MELTRYHAAFRSCDQVREYFRTTFMICPGPTVFRFIPVWGTIYLYINKDNSDFEIYRLTIFVFSLLTFHCRVLSRCSNYQNRHFICIRGGYVKEVDIEPWARTQKTKIFHTVGPTQCTLRFSGVRGPERFSDWRNIPSIDRPLKSIKNDMKYRMNLRPRGNIVR